MPNGSGKTIAIVVSIVLGAATLVSTTYAITNGSIASRVAELEKRVTEEEKSSDVFTTKLDYISKGIDEMKETLKEHVNR